MFVSSYNTYIHTNSTDKTTKTKELKSIDDSKSFATKLFNTSKTDSLNLKNTPINYVDNPKVFYNRQKLEQNIESNKEFLNANKFNGASSLKNAKAAYNANTIMFSIVPKPKGTLSPLSSNTKANNELPLSEKLSAINTYLLNDRYYRITA